MACALLVITAISPGWGLIALVIVLPMAPVARIYTGSRIGPAETAEFLVLPCLVAAGIHVAREGVRRARWLAVALLSLSFVVALPTFARVAEQLRSPWVRTSQIVGRHLITDYFVAPTTFRGLHSATSWIEASALALVTVGILSDPKTRRRLVVACLLAGGTAVAVFSVRRLIQISIVRPHPVATAIGFLGALRFHPFYADVNAAGSYLALFAVPTLWSALKNPWWAPAAASVSIALWLTGSRAGTVAAVFGCACCWLASRPASRRSLIVGLIVATVIAGAVFANPAGPHTEGGVSRRLELTSIGLSMAASSPLFGVGLDRFKPIAGENAHNQFVQILAEMGGLGLVAFVWVLLSSAACVREALRGPAPSDRALVGLCGGLIAFLFSSLFGHPFLTSEILLSFMLALGVTVGVAVRR